MLSQQKAGEDEPPSGGRGVLRKLISSPAVSEGLGRSSSRGSPPPRPKIPLQVAVGGTDVSSAMTSLTLKNVDTTEKQGKSGQR